MPHNCIIVPFQRRQLKYESTFSLQNTGSKHDYKPSSAPESGSKALSCTEKICNFLAFPAENGVQSIESIQEKREIGNKENSTKFPVGRTDFNSD